MVNKYAAIVPPFVIFVLSLVVYITLAGKLTFIFETHPANYFSHLSYAFLQGKLHLINPPWDHDLSLFNNKYYMYWGPSPVLLVIPIVYFFGLEVSDKLYTAIYASLSPVLIYLILSQLKQIGIIVSIIKKILISLFFAFGTVHLYLSADGGVWFTSQIFSTLYILISMLFILKYFTQVKIEYLTLGGIFFGLSFIGRPTFIFYIIFYLALIVIKNYLDKKLLIKHLSVFLMIICIFFVFEGIYNFARFGSVWETGHNFHNAAAKFTENIQKYGKINVHYIPINLYYLFINIPQSQEKFPFFDFSLDGNSILFTSPLFLLTFLLVRKRFWQKKEMIYFNLAIIVSIITIVTFLSVYFSTGFIQFGYRYALDFIPLLILLLAEIASMIHVLALIPLFILSILINMLGALWFLKIFPG